MNPPTPEQITKLIARRERLTNRRDERINFPAVDEIDARLALIPVGERPDVDALLGRREPPPERVEYFTPDPNSPRETLARQQRADMDDETLLANWPLCAAACQIRRERITARWSSDADRADWKDAAAQQTAQAAQQKVSEFEAHMRMLCADYEIEAPDTPGMWK